MDSYNTFKKSGTGEIIDRKSKFIAYSTAVTSETQAEKFIRSVKANNKSARHAVYAYIIHAQSTERFSDDGEPSGTGGKPVLEMLRGQGLTDCCVVVVRYFGGVLLGTGGLVRAYGGAAKLAAENSGTIVMRSAVELCIKFDYTFSGKLKHLLSDFTYIDEGTDYTAFVQMKLCILEQEYEKLLESLSELTGGTAEVEAGGKSFRNFDK